MPLRPLLISGLLASTAAFAPAANNNVYARTSSALSVAVDTSDIKNGLTIELDGEPYKVLNFSIMKQARGAAKTTIKFKNLKRGNTIENTYRSGEKFETAQIDRKPSQYTYEDESGNYFFMDSESFEEVMVESAMIEDQKKWISEGMECDLVWFKGAVIEVIQPSPYVYEVTETEPNVKGNTAQGYTKPRSNNSTTTMPLTAEEEANAKAVFEALDSDGSGKITKDNFKDALVQAGFTAVTDDDVEALIDMVDQDGSGTISYAEFIAVVEARPIRKRIEAALRKLFEALDQDGSGYITQADLRKLIDDAGFGDDISDDDLAEVISQLDDKGDGKVSFDEFMSIFTQ